MIWRLLILCSLLAASQTSFAQCSGYGFGGPSSSCVNSSSSYFVYGSPTCSISNVSGASNARTWAGPGSSSITWLLAGSYTINYSCNCGTIYQVVTVSGPPSINGSISPGSQSICQGATPSSINAPSYTGSISGWQKKRPSDPSWTDISGTAGLNSLTSGYINNNETYLYQMLVFQCGQTVISNQATVTVIQPDPTPPTPSVGDVTNSCGTYGPIQISTNYNASYTIRHHYYDNGDHVFTASTPYTQTVYISSYTPSTFAGTTKQVQLQVEVVNGNGCASVWSGVQTINYTVNPPPTAPPLTILWNSQPLSGAIKTCAGEAVSLTSSGGSSSFTWYNTTIGGGPISTSNSLSGYVPPSTPSVQTFSVSAYWASPCTGGTTITASFQMNVSNQVATLQLPATPYCTGTSPTFGVSLPSGPTGTTYSWNLSGGTTGSGSTFSLPTSLAANSYTLNLTVTAAFPGVCQGTVTMPASNSFTLNQTPTAPTVSGSTRFLPGSLTLTASGSTPAPADYNWTSPQGTTHTATLITNTVNTTTANYAQVQAVSSAGCLSPIAQVTVNILDNPTIVFSGPNYIPIAGQTTLGTLQAYDTYAWTNSLSQNLGSNSSINITTSDTYTVQVTKSGASATVSKKVEDNLDNQTWNFITENEIQIPGISTENQIQLLPIGSRIQKVQYSDGLGRSVQSVTTQGSPTMVDLVKPQVYDTLGREPVKYLPFTLSENAGRFKAGSLSSQANFYQTASRVGLDAKPSAMTVFEPSPMNRILEQGATGQTWQPDGVNSYTSTDKTFKKKYTTNKANEVLNWTFTVPDATYLFGKVNAGTASAPLYYAANTLQKTKTKDEQLNEVIEYVDKMGRTVLKRVQVVSGSVTVNDTNYASTYYIYDDFGSLICVIPPEAVSRLTTEYYQTSATDATKDAFLTRWAFRYAYDGRRRMSLKQVPGSGIVYMVYDLRDRLVLTQDANQRSGSTKYWSFTKYDQLNRPILTGIRDTTVALNQTQMQSVVDAHFAKASASWYETYIGSSAGNVHGYTNKAYPVITGTAGQVDPNKYLSVTYYDDYSFTSLWQGNYAYTSLGLSESENGVVYTQPSTAFAYPNGKPTGGKIKVLDGGVTGGGTWLKSVTYYDDRYRVIQTLADNYKGGTDVVTNVVDFSGRILKSQATHNEMDVTWKDLVGANQVGNNLVNTAASGWGNSGAASVQILPSGQNGWVEVTVSEIGSYSMIGLSPTNTNAHYNTINFALYKAASTLAIYESGYGRGTFGSVIVGDILRVERTGTTITYKKNGVIFYTSLTSSSGSLLVDCASNSTGGRFTGVRTSFSFTSHTVTRRMQYNHVGQLMKVYHQLDAQPEVILVSNQYNELGQLVDKSLHSTDNGSTYKQSVDYRYNIRGWLMSMNNSQLAVNGTNDDPNDLFGIELTYDQVDAGISNTAMFNGNISGMKWSQYPGTGSTTEKGYTFTYDPLNRILGSTYKEKTGTWGALSSSGFAETGLTYDLNGNIKTLTRNDRRGTGTMDILAYDYGTTISNQLMKVTDTGDKFTGFIDGANTGNDYTYDVNGNMITDQNKGITSNITYNYLNLPELVNRGANTVRYIYDATGKKVCQVVTFGASVKQTDYVGEYIYENDALQFVNHEEGRIVIGTNKLIYTNPGEAAADFTTINSTVSAVTQNGTEKYIKVTSSGTTAGTGVFPIGGTFPVNASEIYRIRTKGYRTGSNPAYILIKANGVNQGWPGATLASTVASEAWTEQYVTIPAGATTLQAGVIWNTVASGEIMYINEFEITKIGAGTPEYQYHLKDHLGNVRTTFTTVQVTDQTTATYEPANQSLEQSQYVRYSNARLINATLFNHTAAGSYSERLSGSANEKYGLAKSISVMPGDVITAEVYAKYVDPNSSNWTPALTTLMGQIASVTAGVVIDGAYYSSSTSSFPFAGLLSTAGSTGGPKAYLNWIVFDRNYVMLTGGYQRLSSAPIESGNNVAHERMASPNINITQPGYVYIYLSNEETTPVEVYFDDFKVTQTKSPIVAQDDYYPFGLNFNSFSRENNVVNKWKFQGQLHVDDLGLNWDSFKWRNHQPEIGRFFNIDPVSEKYYYNSTYAFSENKVISHRELEGLEAENINTQTVSEVNSEPIWNNGDFEANRVSFTLTQQQVTTQYDENNVAVATIETTSTSQHTIILRRDGAPTYLPPNTPRIDRQNPSFIKELPVKASLATVVTKTSPISINNENRKSTTRTEVKSTGPVTLNKANSQEIRNVALKHSPSIMKQYFHFITGSTEKEKPVNKLKYQPENIRR